MKKEKIAVVIIENEKGEILLAKKINDYERKFIAGKWVLFGGHVETNEDPKISVAREVFEETKCKIKDLEYFYSDHTTENNTNWENFIFTAKLDSTANIQIDFSEKEYEKYAWFKKEDIPWKNLFYLTKENLKKYFNEK